MNATHIVKASEIERAWYLVDAEGLTLGRVASEVAKILKQEKIETEIIWLGVKPIRRLYCLQSLHTNK